MPLCFATKDFQKAIDVATSAARIVFQIRVTQYFRLLEGRNSE
jgi:hypothetical protein